jgi:hypothetical protein
MRWAAPLLLTFGFLVAMPHSAHAEDDKPVAVQIRIIEASKAKNPKWDAGLKKLFKGLPYKGAKLVDEVKHPALAVGSTVTLEIYDKTQKLKVTRLKKLKADKPSVIRLQLLVDKIGLKSKTNHAKPGATFMVRVRAKNADEDVYFAVTPQ